MASPQLTEEQKSSYRWVMAAVCGLLMTTSFISLSSFGILSKSIAETFGLNSSSVTVLGVDSFSIGLFIAFFLGHGGIFDTRMRTGVLVAQIFLIVPQFLIPVSYNLFLLVALRFFQGLMIMMLAIFSLQLEGWFRPSERARSLAFTLGAIMLGSAAGGILSGVLSKLSWQEDYYITGIVMIAGAVVYFIFARNSSTQIEMLKKERSEKHPSAWRNPLTWLMGISQIPVTWTLFSMGGFLPSYSLYLGYSHIETDYVIIVWGFSGFIAAFIGAYLGDRRSRNTESNRDVLRGRMQIMTAADALMGIGALLMILTAPVSYYAIVVAAVINGFLMMFPPNYWALPGNIFPSAIIGAGAFGMGLISNSADAIGPLVSSLLRSHWDAVFIIMAAVALAGIIVNIYISHANLRLPEGYE